MEEEKHLCMCGCGIEIKKNRNYVNHHNRRNYTKRDYIKRDVYCFCGCGKKTKMIIHTINRKGLIKGEYYKFVRDHEKVKKFLDIKKDLFKIEHLCACGCRQKTNFINGRFKKFVLGHNSKINNPFINKKHSENTINNIKQKRAKQIVPLQDTTIEVKIQDYLKLLGIDFLTHQYMKEIEHSYQCDIFIPSMRLVIECDGIYWHKYPTGNNIDHIRTEEMISKGFKVLRLWEIDIRKMTLDELRTKILEAR